MEYVFWTSVVAVGYVYFGYPLIIAALARLVGLAPKKAPFAPGEWPSVSIVVAAHNEAARLPSRVFNLLDLDYPGSREIIVVSDGSSDATAAALAPFTGAVWLIEVPRGGKPLALNAGVAAARGDILVFADARQRFAQDAIRELVANFSDPRVGGATGELVLECERESDASTVGEGVGLYWRYEKWQRRNESQVRSTLGATGAIYALRRSLWQPLPAETLLDDVLAPMRAVLAGHRVVFDDRAIAYDRAAADAAVESRRKTRTLAGNYQILAQEPRLLLPVANPVWFQYLSHKVGRLLVPWALVALAVSSAALAGRSWAYTIAFVLQLAFYGMAAAGACLEWSERRRTTRLQRRPAFEDGALSLAGKDAR
jgi:cellulose synthase/poly-beta-1,6-N-acetylglucosamine synthase-like glycosyltransferase